jgi:very-short-patch-repair endonuclease
MSAKTEARKKRRQKKHGRTQYGHKLNLFRPKSKLWFEEQLKINDLRFPFDKNITFGGYIPDFISKFYKVIVEVDGSIHNLENVKKKDLKKEIIYKRYGYEVIRVKAYDNESLNFCLKRLLEIRLSKPYILD